MIIDGRSLSHADSFDADVCIVGAGPAGISVALEVARKGARVCLLESGGKERDADSRKLSEGTSSGYWYYPLSATRSRCFGGTSALWLATEADRAEGFRGRPLDPIDFEARSSVPFSGWPFARRELEPFYERAQALCGLGPYTYEHRSWETSGARALPLNGRVRTEIFQHGFKSFTSHLDEVANEPGITLILHATILEIETDESGRRVTQVRVGRLPSPTFSVRARLYVLAAGGIENARLLLLSHSSHSSGLGNAEDLVGRFFMERLTGGCGYIVPTSPELLKRVLFYSLHSVRGTMVHPFLCPTNEAIRAEGALGCSFLLVPRARAAASEAVRSALTLRRALRRRPLPDNFANYARNAIAGVPDLARLAYGRFRGVPHHDILALRVQAEQAPNAQSRVMLDPKKRDPFGLPQARLEWRITEFDRWSIRCAQDLLDGALRAAGLGWIENKLGDEHPPALFLGSYHHMGTTRMHSDPRRGVVDADCRVHGVSNLFVAGSSTFPTSGYANPTLTIVALALRLAERLRYVLEERR